ncbi:MAG: peptidoglycan editing factor PgeF [Alkalibacterium sp.]|nr:peptidoglycan editing factor PgeF [Alkalibacterium sp.]
MHSKLLEQYGVHTKVAGSDYNFRYQMAGNKVVEDMNRLLVELNLRPKDIYTGQQMHTSNVAYVDGTNGDPFVFGKTVKETDGLLTDKPDVALLIKYADCTPVILFDPVNKVLANIHSGWRGTTQRITTKAIEQMKEDYGTKPETLIAYIGPSIDQDHYEVGPEVYEAFSDFKDRDQFFIHSGEKYKLSMLDANIDSLLKAGVLPENMESERASTFTDPRLHSARGEGKDYQLNGLFAMMSNG